MSTNPIDPQLAEEWNGSSFLATVHGDLGTFPPLRVLFLAWRVQATGHLKVGMGDEAITLHLHRGRICQVTGVSNLLTDLGPPMGGAPDLVTGVGLAVNARVPLERVQAAVRKRLTAVFSDWAGALQGNIEMSLGVPPPPGALPLDWDLPQVLTEALRGGPGADRLIGRMERTEPLVIRGRPPTDSPEARWGLDPLSMRILRLAADATPVQKVIAEVVGGNPARRSEVLQRLHALAHLGLVTLEVAASPPPPQRKAAPAAPPSPPRTVPLARPPDRVPPVDASPAPAAGAAPPASDADQQVARLLAIREALSKAPPLERLELDKARRKPTMEEVGTAFREVSKRFHPDRHVGVPGEVARLAADCFGLVNDASELLADPEVMAEEWRRIECLRAGVPYVSTEATRKARISFKRGELQFRNRDFMVAEACFAEAVNQDPSNATYVEMHAFSAYLAKQMPAAEALSRLDSAPTSTGAVRASIQVTAGRILRLEGAPEAKVLERFQAALKADSTNHDAQREIRLAGIRARKTPPPSPGKALLGKLLRRGDDEAG